jgi:uncharacterized membrane protein
MNYKWLYFGVLSALFLMMLTSLGSGFWGGTAGNHWTEQLYRGVCHQISDRSFTINGQPMAVNSRCFGIFSGMFAGWAFIPALKNKIAGKKWPIWFLLFAGFIQIIDYSGNLFDLWENTNVSRAALGMLFGLSCSIIVADLFQPTNN